MRGWRKPTTLGRVTSAEVHSCAWRVPAEQMRDCFSGLHGESAFADALEPKGAPHELAEADEGHSDPDAGESEAPSGAEVDGAGVCGRGVVSAWEEKGDRGEEHDEKEDGGPEEGTGSGGETGRKAQEEGDGEGEDQTLPERGDEGVGGDDGRQDEGVRGDGLHQLRPPSAPGVSDCWMSSGESSGAAAMASLRRRSSSG